MSVSWYLETPQHPQPERRELPQPLPVSLSMRDARKARGPCAGKGKKERVERHYIFFEDIVNFSFFFFFSSLY